MFHHPYGTAKKATEDDISQYSHKYTYISATFKLGLDKVLIRGYHIIEHITAIRGKITGSCARILKGLRKFEY
jgi:hypothetical protein